VPPALHDALPISGRTVSTLVPSASSRAWTCRCAPSPSATMVITAAIPMMMPSIVRNARSLFDRIALNATRRTSPMSMSPSSAASACARDRTAVALAEAVEHLLLLLLEPGDGHEDHRLAGLETPNHFRVVPVVQAEED